MLPPIANNLPVSEEDQWAKIVQSLEVQRKREQREEEKEGRIYPSSCLPRFLPLFV